VNEADLLVALVQETQVDAGKLRRVASLPPDLGALELAEYAGQDWTDPATPTGQRVLDIIAALGSIGSSIANVAGAIAGVRAL
jgi:hypothetical protein